MADLPEICALNNIVGQVNYSKNEVLYEKSTHEVVTKEIEKLRQELLQRNNENEMSKERLVQLKIQNVEYKNTLDCVTNAAKLAVDVNSHEEKLLKKLKGSNEELKKSDEKTIAKYQNKWKDMHQVYKSSSMAVELDKKTHRLKLMSIKSDLASWKLKSVQKAKKQYDQISHKRMQKLIVDFARSTIDSSNKRNIMNEMKQRLEIKKKECETLKAERESISSNITNLSDSIEKSFKKPTLLSETALNLPMLKFRQSNVPTLELPLTPITVSSELNKSGKPVSLQLNYSTEVKTHDNDDKYDDINTIDETGIVENSQDMNYAVSEANVANENIAVEQKFEIISDIRLNENEAAMILQGIHHKPLVIQEHLNTVIILPKSTDAIKNSNETTKSSQEKNLNSNSIKHSQHKRVKFNEDVIVSSYSSQEIVKLAEETVIERNESPNPTTLSPDREMNSKYLFLNDEPQYSKYFDSKNDNAISTQLSNNTSMIALTGKSSIYETPENERQIELDKSVDMIEKGNMYEGNTVEVSPSLVKSNSQNKNNIEDFDSVAILPSSSVGQISQEMSTVNKAMENILKNMPLFMEILDQGDTQSSINTYPDTNMISAVVSPGEDSFDYRQLVQMQSPNEPEVPPNITNFGNTSVQAFNLFGNTEPKEKDTNVFNFNFDSTKKEGTDKNSFFGFF